MQTTNKTTSAKKYTVVSDSFVGPLMPNQIRESEIEIKNFNYDEIDYSQLSINQTEEEKIANSKAKEYIQKNADANGDGVVDEVDLSIYDRFDTNPGLGSVVDLTGDGKINSEDKSLLEKYLFDAPNLSSYLSDYTLLEYEKVVEKEQYESALSAINDKISSLDKELSKYDYNKDGKVDENDINLIIANYDISKSMSLNVEFSDDLFLKNQKTGVNYDVNGDGIVDSKDVDELNNKIKELSDLKNSVTLIESFIPSIESEIEKYSYYKTLVSSDFESFTLNYSNSSYKELCDYLQERGCNETALNEYINNLTSYVNSSEYNEEEFKKKYAGFEPVFDEFGFCQGMYFDGLAIVEYLKGNYDQVNNLEYFDSLSGYDRFYKYMTEEQKNIFHYLYSKKGKDAALDFANSISDDLNKAEGYEKAMGFISTLEFDENGNLSDDSAEKVRNMMKSGATGTLTGLEDYIVGARDAMLETITGESSYTVWDYQKMYTAALLTQLSSDGIEEVSYEYGQVFGNMILPILISEYATLGLSTSFLPAKATSAIGKGISFASMMPSSYGNSLHQYQASGYDSSSARACALMVSLSDSAAEAVFGSVLGKGSGNILIDICKEGIEEGGSSSLQMGFEYMILGKEVTIEEANEEIGKSALFGMLMAGMMSGKSMISANMYSENINIDCEKALEDIANNPKATVEDVVKNAASNTDVEFGIDSETGAVVEHATSKLNITHNMKELNTFDSYNFTVFDSLKSQGKISVDLSYEDWCTQGSKAIKTEVQGKIASKYANKEFSATTYDEFVLELKEYVGTNQAENDLYEATKEVYRSIVLSDENVNYNAKIDMALRIATEEGKMWNVLSVKEQKEYIDKVDLNSADFESYKESAREELLKIANETIDYISTQYDKGDFFDSKYSKTDILQMIKDRVDPKSYMTEKAYNNWKNSLGEKDGYINIYIVQDARSGAKNYKYFNNKIGADDGAFAMSEKSFKEIFGKNINETDGKLNYEGIKEDLGGVDITSGNLYVIKKKIPIEDVFLTNGGMFTAYDGYFRPGGQTSKGFAEVGVPQFDANDNNVTIKEFKPGVLGSEVLKVAD